MRNISSILLPAINRTRQGSFSLTLQAREEGTNRQLTIDGSDFPEWKPIADKLTEIIPADEGAAMTEGNSVGKVEKEKAAKDDADTGAATTATSDENDSPAVAGTDGDTIKAASAAILAKLLRRLPEEEQVGEKAEGNAEVKTGTMAFRIL